MSRVADILMEQGRIAARRAELQGAIWGNAVQTIGQIPGQYEEQQRRLKQQDFENQIANQNMQIGAFKLDEAKKQAAQNTALGQVWSDPSIYDENGDFNRPAVLAKARAADPALVPHVTELMDRLETAHDERQQKAQALLEHQLDTRGEVADQLLSHEGGPDPGAFHLAVSSLAKGGVIDPAKANEYLALQTPEEIAPHLQSWKLMSPALRKEAQAAKREADKPIPVAEGATLVRPGLPGTTPTTIATGAPKLDNESELARDAMTLGTPNETPTAKNSKAALDRLKPPDAMEPVAVQDAKGNVHITGSVPKGTHFVPQPPNITINTPEAQANIREAVTAMKEGNAPPLLPGRATKEYLATIAEAHRQGFDLAKANMDWMATSKHISSMNSVKLLSLNQSINALPDMLDRVDAVAAKWKGGRFPILNRANMIAAKGGAYGKDVASVANELDARIADVTADLGNVYMGGNSPTDHALELAGKNLNSEWDEKVLHDMVNVARDNVRIRSNSIKHTGVAGASDTNPYGSQTPPAVEHPHDPMSIR